MLFHAGLRAVAIRSTDIALRLLLGIMLARVLGPSAYGNYTYAIVVAAVMTTAAQSGVPNVALRETAKASAELRWGPMRGLWQWADRRICAVSAALVACGALAIWLLPDRVAAADGVTLVIALLLVPVNALVNVRAAVLRALGYVFGSQILENLLRTGLVIALVLLVHCMIGEELGAAHAVTLQLLAALAILTALRWMSARTDQARAAANVFPHRQDRVWSRAALPMLVVGLLQVLMAHTDVLMIGFFGSAEDVGVYRVAVQGAALGAIGLQGMNLLTAPQFARLHGAGDIQALQRLVTMSARISVVLALPIVTGYLLFGSALIEGVFGAEYARGAVPLSILAVGQLANALFGSVAILLTMTGHERESAMAMAVAIVCNVGLNLLLIPAYGIEGAAVATALTMVVWNMGLWLLVRARLGIETSALARVRPSAVAASPPSN